VPTFLQAVGIACLAFALTLTVRPKVRPGPATYAWAVGVDALCITFILAVIIVWPAWWLLAPLLLWGAVTALHITRLRDARAMVRVLQANRAPLHPTHRQQPGDAYGYEAWPHDPEEGDRRY
jgi:polyferredoxin